MKRLLFLFCLLSLLLTGCSLKKKPVTLSPDCHISATEILKITDDYLDGDITAVIAAGQIRDLCFTLNGIYNEPGSMNPVVTNYCEILSYNLTQITEGEQTDNTELLNTRNILADLLGQNKRTK